MMEATQQSQREQVIQGIRELADFLEQNPDVPTPESAIAFRHFYGPDAAENFKAGVKAIRVDQVHDADSTLHDVRVKMDFTGGISFGLYVARNYLIPETHVAPPLPDWLTQYQEPESDQ